MDKNSAEYKKTLRLINKMNRYYGLPEQTELDELTPERKAEVEQLKKEMLEEQARIHQKQKKE